MNEYHVHDQKGYPKDTSSRYTVCRGALDSKGTCTAGICRVVGVADTLWGAKRIARKDRKNTPFYKLPAKELDLD